MAEQVITTNINETISNGESKEIYLDAGVFNTSDNKLELASTWDGKISYTCDQSWVTGTIMWQGDQYMQMCKISVSENTTGSDRTAKFYLTIPTEGTKSDIYVNITQNKKSASESEGEETFIFAMTSTQITLSSPTYLWVETDVRPGMESYRTLSFAQTHAGTFGVIEVNDHPANQPFCFVWYFDSSGNFQNITGNTWTKVNNMVKDNTIFQNYRTSSLLEDVTYYSTISTFKRLCEQGNIIITQMDYTTGNILNRWQGSISSTNTGSVSSPILLSLIGY